MVCNNNQAQHTIFFKIFRPLSKSDSMKRQSQSVPNLNEEDESEVPKFRDAASKQKGKKKGKRRSKSIWNLFSPSKEKEKERRTEPLVTEKFLALTEEGKEEEVDANSSIHGSLEDIKEVGCQNDSSWSCSKLRQNS